MMSHCFYNVLDAGHSYATANSICSELLVQQQELKNNNIFFLVNLVQFE